MVPHKSKNKKENKVTNKIGTFFTVHCPSSVYHGMTGKYIYEIAGQMMIWFANLGTGRAYAEYELQAEEGAPAPSQPLSHFDLYMAFSARADFRHDDLLQAIRLGNHEAEAFCRRERDAAHTLAWALIAQIAAPATIRCAIPRTAASLDEARDVDWEGMAHTLARALWEGVL